MILYKKSSQVFKAQAGTKTNVPYRAGDRVTYGTPEYKEAYDKGEVVSPNGTLYTPSNKYPTKMIKNKNKLPGLAELIQEAEAGKISQFKKQPFQLKNEVYSVSRDATSIPNTKRDLSLMLAEYNNAKKDEQELRTTGQIKNPNSIQYKRNVRTQPDIKQDNISAEQRNAPLNPLQRPLIYLANPEKVLGDLGVPGMETSELDRQAINRNRFNPYQSRTDRFLNNAKIGLGYVPQAALNTAMAAAFMPEGSGALGLINETLNPLAGMKNPFGRTREEWSKIVKQHADKQGAPALRSEIDWAKWNKEIPNNPQLMKEYSAIEKAAKDNGTWMKYSDGSAFNGTSEQFVQMKHPNTQKFAGGVAEAEQMYKDPLYRGAHRHVVDFKNRAVKDHATFLTNSEKNAETYATSDGGVKKYFHPDIDKEIEVNGKYYPLEGDGKYQLAIPQNLPKVEGNANGGGWRFLDYDKNIDIDGSKAISNRSGFEFNLGEKKQYHYTYPEDFDIKKDYISTDDYASYVKKNPIGIAKINNVKDQMGSMKGIPANTVYAVDAEKIPIKSLLYNNGLFDMNNSNIYKSVIPVAGASYLARQRDNNQTNGDITRRLGGLFY